MKLTLNRANCKVNIKIKFGTKPYGCRALYLQPHKCVLCGFGMSYIIVKGENEEIVRAYDGAYVFSSESSANRRLMMLRNRIWQHAMEEAARLTSVIRGPGRQKLKELIDETEERVKEYRVTHIKNGY